MPTDKEKRKAMIAEKGDEFFMGYENFGRVMAKRTKSGLIGKGNGKGRIMTSACCQKEAVCGRIGGNGNTLEFFGQSSMYKPGRSPNSQRTIRGNFPFCPSIRMIDLGLRIIKLMGSATAWIPRCEDTFSKRDEILTVDVLGIHLNLEILILRKARFIVRNRVLFPETASW